MEKIAHVDATKKNTQKTVYIHYNYTGSYISNYDRWQYIIGKGGYEMTKKETIWFYPIDAKKTKY